MPDSNVSFWRKYSFGELVHFLLYSLLLESVYGVKWDQDIKTSFYFILVDENKDGHWH